MTQINRLTANVSIDPNDSFPLWSVEAGRTRRITGQTLIEYVTQENIQSIAFNDKGHLIITLNNGDQIDAGEVPKQILTIDGEPVGEINTEGSINALIEDGIATFSVNNKVSLWPLHDVGIGDSPFIIESVDQLGIEYQYTASSTLTQSMLLNTSGLPDGAQIKVTVTSVDADSKPISVTQLRQGGDFTWPVSTPTVFTLRDGDWRVEESSQLLHIQNSTTFDDDAALKQIVHGVAVDPNSSLTMQVNEDGVLIVGGGGGVNGNYVEKYKRADLDYVQMAYQGKFGDSRVYYPVKFNQDSNGWTQLEFTGDMVFKFKDKDTGSVGDKVIELSSGRVTNHKRPYYGDKKLVAEGDSPILGKLQTQRSTRPDFPPVSIYVDEFHNTIMEANAEFKLRHIDADGNTTQTVQTSVDRWNFLVQPKYNNDNLVAENTNVSFNKVSISGTRKDTAYNNFSVRGSVDGGDSGEDLILKTYLRPDGSESPDYIQYFGQTKGNHQLANTESVNEAIADDKAKGEWIGGVLKDTINDDGNPEDEFTCNDPKHWLEYRKTTFNGSFALTVNQGQGVISSEIVIHLHVASGMASAPFKVVTNDGNEITRTIRMGEKWRFFLRAGTNPYFEKIDDGLQSGATDSTFDGEGFGVPERTETGPGTIIQREITGNYRNTSGELGDLVINLRTDNGVKNFRFYYSLPYNTLDSGRKVYVKVDEKAGNNKTIRPGEMWQCEVKVGLFFDSFFWQKVTDGTSSFDAIDTSSFDAEEADFKIVKKSFTNKDMISIPVELPDNVQILVSSVICSVNGKLKKQPFEYQYENGILRVHLNEVCSGIIIAEMIK